jgi:catechol 2,3-dioxygenase-like lactoylglutathione lyase family enzyme
MNNPARNLPGLVYSGSRCWRALGSHMLSLKSVRQRSGPALVLLLLAAGLQAQSNALAGIAHVAFRVGDLARSRDFYGKLGFEQAFAFADADTTSVSFVKINDRQFIELYPRKDASQRPELMHVCFEAQDIAAVHDAYAAEKLDPSAPKKARAGNLLFLLHDPEGHLLEYTQYLPDSIHSKDHGQHLGKPRISRHLVEASIVAEDFPAQKNFFVSKLGFGTGKDPRALNVAGGSGDQIELRAPRERPRMVFQVENLRKTASLLRNLGFQINKERREVSLTDPDGNIVSFRKRR